MEDSITVTNSHRRTPKTIRKTLGRKPDLLDVAGQPLVDGRVDKSRILDDWRCRRLRRTSGVSSAGAGKSRSSSAPSSLQSQSLDAARRHVLSVEPCIDRRFHPRQVLVCRQTCMAVCVLQLGHRCASQARAPRVQEQFEVLPPRPRPIWPRRDEIVFDQ